MGKKFSLHLAQAAMSLEKEKIIRKNIEGDYPSEKEIIRGEIIQETKKRFWQNDLV